MQTQNVVTIYKQYAQYTVSSSSYANIGGFILTVIDDGVYDILSICTVQTGLTATRGAYLRLASGGNGLTAEVEVYQQAANASTIAPATLIEPLIKLRSGGVVTLQAKYDGGNTTIQGLGGFLSLVKRGV